MRSGSAMRSWSSRSDNKIQSAPVREYMAATFKGIFCNKASGMQVITARPDYRRIMSILKKSPVGESWSIGRNTPGYFRKGYVKRLLQAVSANLQQNFIPVYRNRENLESVGRIVKAAPGFEVEPVAVTRAGEMPVLDDDRIHRRPLMRTFVLAGEDLTLDIDQQDLLAVDSNSLFPEIRDF